jgi:hypothetical protein
MHALLNQLYHWTRTVTFVLLTPWLEKNPAKSLRSDIPLVFSMSRVVASAFAAALVKQAWSVGIAGWPDATLCIALVFAGPLLAALDRVSAKEVLEFGEVLLSRFGVGGVRSVGSLYREDPETSVDREHEVIS